MKRTCPTHKDQDELACPVCGYKDKFIEVMAEEAHLVNGRRDYIKLVEGVVDHYLCWKCGSTFQTEASNRA
jgi:hypothetical protein